MGACLRDYNIFRYYAFILCSFKFYVNNFVNYGLRGSDFILRFKKIIGESINVYNAEGYIYFIWDDYI